MFKTHFPFYSFNNKAAVKRILVGKFGTCAGQACITIDYILVEKKFLLTLVRKQEHPQFFFFN